MNPHDPHGPAWMNNINHDMYINLTRIYIFTLSVEDPLALPRLELELPPEIEINRSKSHPL